MKLKHLFFKPKARRRTLLIVGTPARIKADIQFLIDWNQKPAQMLKMTYPKQF